MHMTLDDTAGTWLQDEKFTLGHLFSKLGFPEIPCRLECVIYSPYCYRYVECTVYLLF